jgi:hypothetical protein
MQIQRQFAPRVTAMPNMTATTAMPNMTATTRGTDSKTARASVATDPPADRRDLASHVQRGMLQPCRERQATRQT